MIIGLDTGGTHVDAVLIDNKQIIDTAKYPTDKTNLLGCIWETIEQLMKGNDIKKIEKINLSTTISTNAIVENKTQPVAMFIESGPGLSPSNFACGDYNVFLEGYIDHRGREIKPINIAQVKKELKSISDKNINSAAIVCKFCTRNPMHEKQITDMLISNGFQPVTAGHTLSGKLNFPRRIYTSYLNSAVSSSFMEFSTAIKKACSTKGLEVPIHILKADGGTINLNDSEKHPVQTILSGPAASVMGCLAMTDSNADSIFLDIGGTTTDISFTADGVPLFEPEGITISNYPTLVRAIHSTSIGLGGDSAVVVSKEGNIKIGPERKGPPIALGGTIPTPTDAMIALGLMHIGNSQKAKGAMADIGKKLNISPLQAAQKIYDTFGSILKHNIDNILREINRHPVYTIHELLHGKKIKPRSMIIIGGPAKATAPIISKKLNLPYTVPHNYEITNAVGAALTRNTFELTLLADTERKILSVPEIGLYQHISSNYTLSNAKQDAAELIKTHVEKTGFGNQNVPIEITEENSFNMVRGFFVTGKNIRVAAQVKPGLIYKHPKPMEKGGAQID